MLIHRYVEYKTIGLKRFLLKGPFQLKKLLIKYTRTRKSKQFFNPNLTVHDARTFSGNWLAGSKHPLTTQEKNSSTAQAILKKAEQFSQKQFYTNGKHISLLEYEDEKHWSVSPDTMKRWPETHFSTPLDYSTGNLRFTWQISRIYHIVTFAQAWRITQADKWHELITQHITEVFSEAPIEYGIHWRDGLQLAVRIFSLLAAADLCHDAPDSLKKTINAALTYHAETLLKQISPRSSITNNHSIGESAALISVGLYLNNSELSRYCLRVGEKNLKNELNTQFYDDGMSYEGSLPYCGFILEFLLFTALAYKAAGRNIPEWIQQKTINLATTLSQLIDTNDNLPPLGDGDDARVIVLDNTEYLNLTELLASVTQLYETHGKTTTHNNAELLQFAWWTTGLDKYNNAPIKTSNKINHLHSSGLIYVHQNGLDLWLDCGPTGLGKTGCGGHGHNDTTAVIVNYNNESILHDPGWYSYFEAKLRNHFRKTSSHNTITIDDQEQARILGTFIIAPDCQPTPPQIKQCDDKIIIRCGHTGYNRLKKSITYRRTVVITKTTPPSLHFIDHVLASKPITLQNHLNTPLHVQTDNRSSCLLGKQQLTIHSQMQNFTLTPHPYSQENGVLLDGNQVTWATPYNATTHSSVSKWSIYLQ